MGQHTRKKTKYGRYISHLILKDLKPIEKKYNIEFDTVRYTRL